jgi:hypothetical protein
MIVRKSTGTVFDWQGPSLFTLDKKMKQMANGVRAGQLASQTAKIKLEEKNQVFIYAKAK